MTMVEDEKTEATTEFKTLTSDGAGYVKVSLIKNGVETSAAISGAFAQEVGIMLIEASYTARKKSHG